MMQAQEVRHLANPTDGSRVFISQDGLHIISAKGFTTHGAFTPEAFKTATDFGKQLNLIMPMLIEQELAHFAQQKLVIPFDNIYYLYDPEQQFGLLAWL